MGKPKTIAKGYRLKPETHKIILRIQRLIDANQENAVGTAVRKYYDELLVRREELQLYFNTANPDRENASNKVTPSENRGTERQRTH